MTGWARIVIKDLGLDGHLSEEDMYYGWEAALKSKYPRAQIMPGVQRRVAGRLFAHPLSTHGHIRRSAPLITVVFTENPKMLDNGAHTSHRCCATMVDW